MFDYSLQDQFLIYGLSVISLTVIVIIYIVHRVIDKANQESSECCLDFHHSIKR